MAEPLQSAEGVQAHEGKVACMTATDTIRAMLDERGVEYYPKRPDVTVWSNGGWHIHAQEDMIEGMLELFVRPATPEQAIEATLGRGELRKERDALDRLTDVLDATNDGLLAENAKLRELVAELASTTVKCQNGECDSCQFGNPTGFGCTWDAHMRELGVEV